MPGPNLQTRGAAAPAREHVVQQGALNGMHATPGPTAPRDPHATRNPTAVLADEFTPDPPGRRRLAIIVGLAAVILVLALLAIAVSTV